MGSSSKLVSNFNDLKSKYHKQRKDKKFEELNFDKNDTEGDASEPKIRGFSSHLHYEWGNKILPLE